METHLKEQYGFNSFRTLQREAIDATLESNDSIVLFPTGGGKSLCYQLPATYLDNITVVISPLISLMADQQLGLKCNSMVLNSTNTSTDFEIMESIQDVNIIYCTPEYITRNSTIIDLLKSLPVCMFAVDEAHCLSEWGHDFRQSYRKLGMLKKEFPEVPVAAFTATATPRVIKDIAEVLQLNNPVILQKGTRRPNLKLSVLRKSNIVDDLLPLLSNTKTTIIYAQTINMVDKITAALIQNGISTIKYHGKLSNKERQKNHTDFVNDKIRTLVATVSFGMGIDKANIRTVIVYGASTNIETYYQEIGRAGRDGIVSDGILFYAAGDFNINRTLLSGSSNVKYYNGLLAQFKQYIESTTCRQYMIERYFTDGKISLDPRPDTVDKCLCDNCTGTHPSVKNIIKDLTKETKLIISLVKSLRTNYGSTKLIYCLTGSLCKAMTTELKSNLCHGEGRYHSTDWWKEFIELMIQHKFLKHILYKNKYQVVTLGLMAINIGIKPVILSVSEDMQLHDVNKTYLSFLYNARSAIAEQDGVAPYMILSDTVILAIATAQPTTLETLQAIDGVTKLMSEEHGDKLLFRNKSVKDPKDRAIPKSTPTTRTTLKLFQQGNTVDEIAESRGIKSSTVEAHLTDEWTLNPELIDEECVGLTQEIYDVVAEAIESVGQKRLRTIKEAVADDITYFQIRTSIIIFNGG